MKQHRGFIEIYTHDQRLFLSQYFAGQLLVDKRPILSHQFSWNYSFIGNSLSIDFGDGAGSSKGSSADSLIMLKWELELSRKESILIVKELNPWQDLPGDWDYMLLEKEQEKTMLVTSANLQRLKQQIG